jgi:hypothetical protein
MSLAITRRVDEQFPILLHQNVNHTCYQFIVKVIAALREQGHQAFHICKTEGEGQFTPPGFQPRTITGLDGKPYRCTGVSHDALWCDGLQFDCIGGGNDAARPIYVGPDGTATFEASGPQIHGTPTWNPIPQEYWRPQNPPFVADDAPAPAPARPVYPSYESLGGDEGGKKITRMLEADYKRAGMRGLDADCGAWQQRVSYDFLTGICSTVEESIAKHRAEWCQTLGIDL